MGGLSNPYASGSEWQAPSSGSRAPPPEEPAARVTSVRKAAARLTAAVASWFVALGVATALLGAELAPRADQTNLPEAAPPPPPAPERAPGHSDGDDVYFDPAELVSV